MSTIEIIAYGLFALAVVLRLLCGRVVKGRASKYAEDAEFHPPIASRWVGPAVVRVGVWISVAATLLAAGLLTFIYFG